MIPIAIEGDTLFKDRTQILQDMLALLQAAVPDAWIAEDGVLRMILDTEAGLIEGLYQANQILLEDTFIQTASIQALEIHGEQYGVPRKNGVPAIGSLKFFGNGGVYIPTGTEVAYDPGLGEEAVLTFETTADATTASPGSPTAPTVAASATAGLPNGTYEYTVTFVTAGGETAPGITSGTVVAALKQINVTNIPIGGLGTTQRKLYRRVVGGDFKLVTTIADNTATSYTDNIADGALTSAPPGISTAESISIPAQAESPGIEYNVVVGAVTILSDVPDGITSVVNDTAFTGGTDEEDSEDYRTRLLSWVRAPQTGSALDLKNWAEEVEGVESATVFENDNLGTPTNGHVTVRITGPNGTTPSAGVIANVQAHLDEKDLANVTIHVATFTAVPTNVTAALTLQPGFVLVDVSSAADQAIRDYINQLAVGGTLYVAGLIDAVFGIPGIATLTVSVPASDQTTAATSKRTPGTITIT